MSGDVPTVSVIVAAFGEPTFLHEALESALAQTFTSFEVLIGDDSANPRTRALVESFSDPRLNYHANPQQLGVAVNHWAGIQRARGRYLTILNHDDAWEPDFLRVLIGILEAEPEAVLAFCDHHVMNPEGQRLPSKSDVTTANWKRDRLEPGLHRPFLRLVVDQSIPMAVGTLFRREAVPLTRLIPSVGPAYDLWLTYLLSCGGDGACYDAQRLSSWREHPGTITKSASYDWVTGVATCWEAIAKDPLYAPYGRELDGQVAVAYLALAKAHLRAGDRTAARRSAGQALFHRKTSLRALAAVLISYLPDALVQRLVKPR